MFKANYSFFFLICFVLFTHSSFLPCFCFSYPHFRSPITPTITTLTVHSSTTLPSFSSSIISIMWHLVPSFSLGKDIFTIPITFIAHVLQSVINSSSLTSISPSVLHIPCAVGIVSCHHRLVQPSSSVSGFPFPPCFFLTVSYGHLP